MFTFSNLRVDEDLTFTLPTRPALGMLDALIVAGREIARDRWERELVAWLADRRWALAGGQRAGIDLGEVAWTPDHFGGQQRFLITVCERGLDQVAIELRSPIARMLRLTAAHGREHVAVGRRWRWLGGFPDLLATPKTH